jgi:hypothetical protein
MNWRQPTPDQSTPMPPSKSAPAKPILSRLEKAKRSLKRSDLAGAEAITIEAIESARRELLYDIMIDATTLLLEIRSQRRLVVDGAGDALTIIEEPFEEELDLSDGRYLVQPPLVGADARRLRVIAARNGVHVHVICREPTTQSGLRPVVAIGPGGVIRTRIEPAHSPEEPDVEWFRDAIEQLGDATLGDLDPDLALSRRLDALMDLLDTIPEHTGVHNALIDCCKSLQIADE